MERRLYFVSDTHHEMLKPALSSKIDIVPLKNGENNRNFLALCGDIGNPFDDKYRAFIQRHTDRFEKIFIVSGNHEYYSNGKQRTMNKIDEQLYKLASEFENVHYLQKNSLQVEDTTFIGCTLWTEADQFIEDNMNDYLRIYIEDETKSAHFKYLNSGSNFGGYKTRKKYIREGRRFIKHMDIYALHHDMKTWIGKTLEKINTEKAIVLTHHAPSFQMLRDLKHDERFEYGYASDCSQFFRKPVVAWLSGHTHLCKEILINNIPSISNCLGYSGQKTGCDLQKYIKF
jgi:predicted MPP superfamily phosphohydrolase